MAAGTQVVIEVTCTQTVPKCIGGLVVGSWKSFSLQVLLKGGWVASGRPDESSVDVILKAFVRL